MNSFSVKTFLFIYFFINFNVYSIKSPSLNISHNDNSSLSINNIIEEEQILLNKVLTLSQCFNKNFITQWQDKKFIDAIDDCGDQILKKTITLDNLMGLHFKAIRLSKRYTEKQMELQRLMLENLDILNNVEYNFQSTKDLKNSKSSFKNTHTLRIPVQKLLSLITKRIKFYIEYQKKLSELWEIENNLFNSLISNIHNYINNRLKLMRIIIKALFLHREIEIHMEQKNNFNDDQLLKKTQKLYKYMDNIFKTMDQMEENLYKIKTLTGEDMGDKLLWDIEKKSQKFWTGSWDSKINPAIQEKYLNDKSFNKFFNRILKKKLQNKMKNSKAFSVINKIFKTLSVDKGDIKNLILKKKINNYITILLENFGDVSFRYNYSYDKKQKKYNINSSVNVSTSLQNIVGGIMNIIMEQYQFNQDLVDINDRSRNLYSQVVQLNAQKKLSIYKLETIEKKTNFYNKRLEENSIKAQVLISEYLLIHDEIKIRLLKYFKTQEEENEKKKNLILMNFLMGNIHSKEHIQQKIVKKKK